MFLERTEIMPNPKPKKEYLKQPKWKALPTVGCRYPRAFIPYISAIARIADNNAKKITSEDGTLRVEDKNSKEILGLLGAIATWASEQENPVKALRQMLDNVQKQESHHQ